MRYLIGIAASWVSGYKVGRKLSNTRVRTVPRVAVRATIQINMGPAGKQIQYTQGMPPSQKYKSEFLNELPMVIDDDQPGVETRSVRASVNNDEFN